ncbi:MAG TPA: site-specific DNA-methyltransferase [Acidobacteriota bacterium]|nr:site-specific DNA-methyltransferase [Acidobacteriota bacterium]HNT16395.1 site-specific DNA-methyltransferase [Acidobacteriota bacterium]
MTKKKDEGKKTLIAEIGTSEDEFKKIEVPVEEERIEALPEQEDFWRPPTRFGSVPVEKEPLGWDRRRGFRKLFPTISLPFQIVERVKFGHPDLEPNRLFWGDNLHVMRQLPSESIDLVYIDPPFFSGRNYNVIFGDKNELRSFSDIWEGGMPGYLIWLNARLYEIKRLLKKSGSLIVHLDLHAVHYVKVELDKIFGHGDKDGKEPGFKNEIIWCKNTTYYQSTSRFVPQHDTILWYSKSGFPHYRYNWKNVADTFSEVTIKKYKHIDNDGRRFRLHGRNLKESPIQNSTDVGIEWLTKAPELCRVDYLDEKVGVKPKDWWVMDIINQSANERIGYPTQKPEELLEKVIKAFTIEGDVVADVFSGGGTTAAVAQRLGRHWIACDQSRVAVAITADRLTRLVEEKIGNLFPVPDFTVEHWGVYEARRMEKMPEKEFQAFVLKAFGAVIESNEKGIHGYKGAIPIWIGSPDQKKAVTSKDVQDFANAIRKGLRYQQDNLRDGMMLAWAFRPDAVEAAERLRRLELTDLNFIRLDMVRIDSPPFRQHITKLSTDHADYENFLTFVQSPKVEVGMRRISHKVYKFDASETIVMNPGAKIINVQWDFDYQDRFSSSANYAFAKTDKKEPMSSVQYEFPEEGKITVACKVQDDMGGEGIWTGEVEVK